MGADRTFKRPTHNGAPHGSFVTTPSATELCQLGFGGYVIGSVALTKDQLVTIQRFYGYAQEPVNERPTPPPQPQRADFKSQREFESARERWETAIKAIDRWTDPRAFLQSGADRNALRYAEVDGLRLLAWLLSHATPGEDPLKILVRLAIAAGWDVDSSDVSWTQDDEDDEDDEDDDVPHNEKEARA